MLCRLSLQFFRVSEGLFAVSNPIHHPSSIRSAANIASNPESLVHRTKALITMKLESSLFKELSTPELSVLSNIFKKYGHEIRMAGGAVRDLLMDKKPVDIDFATTATPDEMKTMFNAEEIRMINMKGEKHGTITARINDKDNFEITTLRIDVVTDGRHAEVEFTKNWELDACRRDLTINSLFLDFDGNVYDYVNGIEDLENQRVRFVGNPDERIKEDYLRILRYFRFYGQINASNEHEESTLDAIRVNMAGLKQISGERIWVELRKILQRRSSFDSMMLKFLELGGGNVIGLPENLNLEEFQRLSTLIKKHDLEFQPITLMAALLADEIEGQKLHSRLKLSSFERDLCLFVILHRKKELPESLPLQLRTYQSILLFSKSKPADTRSWIEETLLYDGAMDLYQKFKEWTCPKFPVPGNMLMEAKVPVGFLMSRVILSLKERWLESDFVLTAEELVAQVPEVLAQCEPLLKTKTKKK